MSNQDLDLSIMSGNFGNFDYDEFKAFMLNNEIPGVNSIVVIDTIEKSRRMSFYLADKGIKCLFPRWDLYKENTVIVINHRNSTAYAEDVRAISNIDDYKDETKYKWVKWEDLRK